MSDNTQKLTYVTPEESKSGPGMIPDDAHHVALIVSLTRPAGVHVGVSRELIEQFGRARCDSLTGEIADVVGRFFEVRQ